MLHAWPTAWMSARLGDELLEEIERMRARTESCAGYARSEASCVLAWQTSVFQPNVLFAYNVEPLLQIGLYLRGQDLRLSADRIVTHR